MQLFEFQISQGNVATHLGWAGNLYQSYSESFIGHPSV